MKSFNLKETLLGGCAFGLESSDGDAIKKPWRFMTDNEPIHAALHGKTCQGGHTHQTAEGRHTTATGHYPTQLATAIHTSFAKYIRSINVILANVAAAATESSSDAGGPGGLVGEDTGDEENGQPGGCTGHRVRTKNIEPLFPACVAKKVPRAQW